MSVFSNSSNPPSPRKQATAKRRTKTRLEVEALEDRVVPAVDCPGISGFVYHDANNNGLYEPTLGETPIANNLIELRETNGTLVASTRTDSNGFYDFDTDPRISTAVTTLTRTASIPLTQTNFDITRAIGQFNPALGELQSIEITSTTSLTSDIKAENASTVSSSTISGTVEGRFALTLPGGQTIQTNPRGNAGTFTAAPYDGVLDYAGSSGRALPTSSATDTKKLTLTGAAMNAFKGTGTVNLRQQAVGASSVTDTAGNADSSIRNRGSATVTVVYRYIPQNCLKPGNYVLVQPTQPTGFWDGKESRAGQVIPNSVGTDSIAVTLTTVDAVHNDFGEIKPSTLSGYVYLDTGTGSYDDGIKTPGEQPIAGVTIWLTGSNDIGQTMLYAVPTDGTGFYKFWALRPGNYILTETQPPGYVDGKDTIGTPGGTTTNDRFSNINLPSAYHGVNNNFGELPTPPPPPPQLSSLSGYVYIDTNQSGGFNDGIKQPDERPIANVVVTLTGSNDQGAVTQTTTTNAAGFYQFVNLRAGNYTVTESQPAGFVDGKDTIGSIGGSTTNDRHFGINLPGGVHGVNYNFGELEPVIDVHEENPPPYPDVFVCGGIQVPPRLSVGGKLDLIPGTMNQNDPVLRAKINYVATIFQSLLGRTVDQGSLIYWVRALYQGVPRSALVTAVYYSLEHRQQQVDCLYMAVFNRHASMPERQYWGNLMVAGWPESEVAAALLASPEFAGAHPGDDGYVRGVFATLSGRTPNSMDMNYWVNRTRTLGRLQVAREFLNVGEVTTKIVQKLYTVYLHTPSAAEVAHHVNLLETGRATPASLAVAFLSSDEFYIHKVPAV